MVLSGFEWFGWCFWLQFQAVFPGAFGGCVDRFINPVVAGSFGSLGFQKLFGLYQKNMFFPKDLQQ